MQVIKCVYTLKQMRPLVEYTIKFGCSNVLMFIITGAYLQIILIAAFCFGRHSLMFEFSWNYFYLYLSSFECYFFFLHALKYSSTHIHTYTYILYGCVKNILNYKFGMHFMNEHQSETVNQPSNLQIHFQSVPVLDSDKFTITSQCSKYIK